MTMTEGEIVRDFKAAKSKAKQIDILAQLNCCSVQTIRDILENNGVVLKGVPKTTSNKDQQPKQVTAKAEKAEKVVEIREVVKQIPGIVKDCVIQRVGVLDDKITELEKALEAYRNERDELLDWVQESEDNT